MALRPGGDQIVTYGHVGGARLWDAATGRPLLKALAEAFDIGHVAFRADGRRLAMIQIAAKDARIGIWDTDSGRLVAVSPPFPQGFQFLEYHPDGRTIAVARTGGLAQLFDPETAQPRGLPMTNARVLATGVFSPDGRLIVSGSFDGTVKFFDAMSAVPLSAILEHAGPIARLVVRRTAAVL